MSKRVTYLVGAGASYHSMPLLATMGVRMRAFHIYLKELQRTGGLKQDPRAFIKELETVLVEENKSTSIDAYAKELSNSRHKELELHRLKLVLAGYFVFEQMAKDKSFRDHVYAIDHTAVSNDTMTQLTKTQDKRYRTFWGEISNGFEGPLPAAVSILSWNYDMQFETSYAAPHGVSLQLAQDRLQVYPGCASDIDSNKFCVVKLNGTAGLFEDTGARLISHFDLNKHALDLYNVDIILEIFNANYHRAFSSPVFTFAWEDTPSARQARRLAAEILSSSEILVVIGYSFPRFNKEVDTAMLRAAEKLERIHLQVPQSDVASYSSRLIAIDPRFKEMIIPENDLNTFYVPHEI